MRRPRAAAACLVLTALVLTGCGQEAQEDADLDGAASAATTSADPTTDPTDAAPTTPATAEPDRDAAAVVSRPDGLSPEQTEVVDAYAAFVLSLERLARTADLEASGIRDTATGAYLGVLEEYNAESVRTGRLSEGPPLRAQVVGAVEVQGEVARMPVCLDQSFWVDVVPGSVTPASPPLVFYDVTMVREDGTWRASEAVFGDVGRCGG